MLSQTTKSHIHVCPVRCIIAANIVAGESEACEMTTQAQSGLPIESA